MGCAVDVGGAICVAVAVGCAVGVAVGSGEGEGVGPQALKANSPTSNPISTNHLGHLGEGIICMSVLPVKITECAHRCELVSVAGTGQPMWTGRSSLLYAIPGHVQDVTRPRLYFSRGEDLASSRWPPFLARLASPRVQGMAPVGFMPALPPTIPLPRGWG